ncbi:potassium channel subfamily K member 1-like [Scyliorhinus torazame]|uniref:potassium channel subfamily K member 1-like n=1 Tax=Scyliorhinus torazame TaxID=75743 RepID=UPI003B5C821B
MTGEPCPCCSSYLWKLVACFLLYVLFGTVVFSAIEQPWEMKMRRDLEDTKDTFLRDHPCLREDELDTFLHGVLDASNYGVSALRNASDDENWDLSSSLFFVSTVLTTTGYGHSVPFTNGGKGFCMLYSVLGIPITLLLLTSLVQRLMFYVHWVPITYIHTQWGIPTPVVARVHATVIGGVVIACFFLIPAAAFVAMEENWNYLESLYFCFISLSTVGLGDYVPGKSKRHPNLKHLYKIGIACYLVIGLVALLVVLETFYELQELQRFINLIMGHPDRESLLHVTEYEEAITTSKPYAGDCLDDRRKEGRGPEGVPPGTAGVGPSPEQ